ncbi:MAG TPA: peptidylprolyl isomerase [Bacteroidales bacterium]|nr:peptidylprolyl isomerase [Bacteroidales bacterium]
MAISENKVVSIIYQLRKDNQQGEVVEELTKDKPLTFLFGRGNLLPKFEENLDGLKEGDAFTFGLNSEEAYGPVQENAIVDVPIDVFRIEGELDDNLLKLGNTIPMLDREGNRLNGTVKEIGEEAVKMDFNHPMAGTNLYFSGEVTCVREANSDELEHGHVHDGESCEGCDKDDCHGKHEH